MDRAAPGLVALLWIGAVLSLVQEAPLASAIVSPLAASNARGLRKTARSNSSSAHYSNGNIGQGRGPQAEDNPFASSSSSFNRRMIRDVNTTKLLARYEQFHKENIGRPGTNPFNITEAFSPRQIDWNRHDLCPHTVGKEEKGDDTDFMDLQINGVEKDVLYDSTILKRHKEIYDRLQNRTASCLFAYANTDLFNPLLLDMKSSVDDAGVVPASPGDFGFTSRSERLRVATYFESLLGSTFKFLLAETPRLSAAINNEQIFLNNKGVSSVAIHFRTGFAGSNVGVQDFFNMSNQPQHLNQFDQFKSCASNLRGVVPMTNISSDVYLATDSQMARDKYCSDSHILCSNVRPTHMDIGSSSHVYRKRRGKEKGEEHQHGGSSSSTTTTHSDAKPRGWDGLLELMLLARSPCLVMSCSGMSLVAAHIGDAYTNRCAYRGFDCQPFENKVSCVSESAISQHTWLTDTQRANLHLLLKQRRSEQTRDIVLLFTNAGYTNLTMNALCSLKNVNVENFLVISYDQEGCRLLENQLGAGWGASSSSTSSNRFCTVMDWPESSSRYGSNAANFGSESYKNMMRGRSIWIYEALKSGTNVLFMDSDIVAAQNPFPYLHHGDNTGGEEGGAVDIQLQLDPMFGAETSPAHVPVNGGLFYIRSTLQSRNLVAQTMNVIIKSRNLNDQDALNLAVLRQKGLSYRILPPSLFPNGIRFYRREVAWEQQQQQQQAPSLLATDSSIASGVDTTAPIMMMHNNYVTGIARKIQRFKASRLWYLSPDGQSCSAPTKEKIVDAERVVEGGMQQQQQHHGGGQDDKRERIEEEGGMKRLYVVVLGNKNEAQLPFIVNVMLREVEADITIVKGPTEQEITKGTNIPQHPYQNESYILVKTPSFAGSAMSAYMKIALGKRYNDASFIFRQFICPSRRGVKNDSIVEQMPVGYSDAVNAVPPHESLWLTASEKPVGINYIEALSSSSSPSSSDGPASLLSDSQLSLSEIFSKDPAFLDGLEYKLHGYDPSAKDGANLGGGKGWRNLGEARASVPAQSTNHHQGDPAEVGSSAADNNGDDAKEMASPLKMAIENVSSERYRQTLLQSALTLCPKTVNIETSCIYDSMEVGSIPVMIKDAEASSCLPSLISDNSGVIWLKRWSELAHMISIMYTTEDGMRFPSPEMDRLQTKVMESWSGIKNELATRFHEILNKHWKR